MAQLPQIIDQFIDDVLMKHVKHILIFLFTMMIGMAIGATITHAQIKTATTSSTIVSAQKRPTIIVVGTVTAITPTDITIKQENQQTVSFKITNTTRIEAPGVTSIKGKATVKNIAANDMVAVASSDQATASLIVIDAKGNALQPQHKVFLGVVSSREATNSGTVLSLKHPKDDVFSKVLVNTQTKITARGIDKPTIDDIKAGDKVLVVGPANTQDIIVSTRLYLIPGKARGFLDKVSPSVSSQPTSSKPSATATTKTSSSSAKP